MAEVALDEFRPDLLRVGAEVRRVGFEGAELVRVLYGAEDGRERVVWEGADVFEGWRGGGRQHFLDVLIPSW